MRLPSLLFLLAFITTVNNRKIIQKHQELEKNMGQNDFWSELGITCVMLHEKVFQPWHPRVHVLFTMRSCTYIPPHNKLSKRALLISYHAGEQIFNNTQILNNTALSIFCLLAFFNGAEYISFLKRAHLLSHS